MARIRRGEGRPDVQLRVHARRCVVLTPPSPRRRHVLVPESRTVAYLGLMAQRHHATEPDGSGGEWEVEEAEWTFARCVRAALGVAARLGSPSRGTRNASCAAHRARSTPCQECAARVAVVKRT